MAFLSKLLILPVTTTRKACRRNYGLVLLELGKFSEAIEQLTYALELDETGGDLSADFVNQSLYYTIVLRRP